jgi:DNA-binding transcriptional LysR family regulator
MKPIDHWSLDGHALRLLVTVAEAGSVTAAAVRLGLTQSAVSHALDRLRAITGDALFVRQGRGIVATPQAGVLVQRARVLLDELRAFSELAGFDPARWSGVFTVAANDLQRDLLLPPLLRRLRVQAPGFVLRVLPSGAPRAELLRGDGCDLLLTPRPPDAGDLVQRRLFEDRYAVFHDADHGAAPRTRAAWLAAEHVSVRYEDGRGLDLDAVLAARGLQRRIVATVPGFGGLASLLRGGPWLATVPARLGQGALRGLASAPVPVPTPRLPMFAVWHVRRQQDPAHRWVRAALLEVVAGLGASTPSAGEPVGR